MSPIIAIGSSAGDHTPITNASSKPEPSWLTLRGSLHQSIKLRKWDAHGAPRRYLTYIDEYGVAGSSKEKYSYRYGE